jgi:hypothetical protein
VVVATSCFRLALPGDLAANESSDLTTFYRPVAEQLLDGEGLTTPDGDAALRHPPGYPVLLAGAYATGDVVGLDHGTSGVVLAVVCAGLAGVLLWAVARCAFGSRVAVGAVAVWCLHPVHLWLAKQPNSELPYEVLLYAAVLCCVPALEQRSRVGAAAACGALLAGATLLRPSALALVPAVLVVLWLFDRRLPLSRRALGAGALLGAYVLVLLPWSWWASTEAGHLVVGADAVEVNVVEGLSLGIDSQDEADDLVVPAGARGLAVDTWRQEPALQEGGPLREHVLDQVQEQPGAATQLLGVKLARSWYGNEAGRWEGFVAVLQLAFVGLATWGGVRAWRAGGTGRRYVALVSALVLAAWASTVLVHSLLRHQVPTLGLASPLVALALLSLLPAARAEKATSSQT